MKSKNQKQNNQTFTDEAPDWEGERHTHNSQASRFCVLQPHTGTVEGLEDQRGLPNTGVRAEPWEPDPGKLEVPHSHFKS